MAVTLFTFLTVGVVFFPPVGESPLRIVVGLAFLLFVPGYVFVSVLFPEAYSSGDPPDAVSDGAPAGTVSTRVRTSGGIDGVERGGLAFGTSLAVVAIFGIALHFTPWGIRLVPTVVAGGGLTLAGVVAATYRRRSCPPERRFSVPYRSWIDTARNRVFDADARIDAVLRVVLALSILLAVGSVTFAVAAPPDGEQFSNFYLVTETETGELVADDYPEELTVGESEPVVVGIENNEQSTTTYTLVVEIQDVTMLEDNRVEVTDRERLTTFEPTLEDGESVQWEHELASTMTGEQLRVTYLLYVGEPPAEPTTDTADYSLHFWVDVTEP